MFFALRPKRSCLSDLNEELVNCYRIVRDEPDALIKQLRSFKNTETDYYRVRATNPRKLLTRAARLLYLTRLRSMASTASTCEASSMSHTATRPT